MNNVSRRSVTKGAAWAAPAVAIGAAAPAFASSPTPIDPSDPTNPPDFIVTNCTAAVIGISGASNYTHVVASGGSRHTWNIGYLDVQSAPPGYGITGFRLSYGDIRTHTYSGDTYVARNRSALVTTAQAVPFGVALAPTFATDMPYAATCLEPTEHVVRMEMDFCITWLRGLSATAPNSQGCCYTIISEWYPNQAGIACSTKFRAASGRDRYRNLVPRSV